MKDSGLSGIYFGGQSYPSQWDVWSQVARFLATSPFPRVVNKNACGLNADR